MLRVIRNLFRKNSAKYIYSGLSVLTRLWQDIINPLISPERPRELTCPPSDITKFRWPAATEPPESNLSSTVN